MRKLFLISIIITIFFTAEAQNKKYVYEDSTLEQAEELYTPSPANEVIQAPAEETLVEEEKEDAAEERELVIDTALNYTRLNISPDTVEQWKKLQAFAYVKHLDSLLKAKKDNAKNKDDEQDNYRPPENRGNSWLDGFLSSGGLQIFLWTLAAFFIVFILYKLFLTEGVFRKTPRSQKANAPDAEEEIINNDSDFDILIKQAQQAGNYRLAVRYQYLQTLHKLADKNLVELAADKTNYQYVREITNQNYQQDFAALTLNYEYVWYGEFNIDVIMYKRVEIGFSQFNSKL
jgi:biopolymer transport protein ExbD